VQVSLLSMHGDLAHLIENKGGGKIFERINVMPTNGKPKKPLVRDYKKEYQKRIENYVRKHPGATRKEARGYHAIEIKSLGTNYVESKSEETIYLRNKRELSKFSEYKNAVKKAERGKPEALDKFKGEFVRDKDGKIIFYKNGQPKIKGNYYVDSNGHRHLFITDDQTLYDRWKLGKDRDLNFHSDQI